ncbi:MAG: N(G),N(G)-dimethylarginine dimethylaminohydrolase [Desulfobacterales bacterium]|nr:N(G),N(G)-dimethylarginine dimethylaminohydrolase [Desulfobacterales bacterium]
MFTNAIVRKPARAMIHGITTANLGAPNYEKALEQHQRYVEALQSLGVQTTVMEADENFPDSVFVEDCAVLTEKCAIIANPGAPSRKGETAAVEKALKEFYTRIEHVDAPGTLDGGDVMRVADHFYTGVSERTNAEGAARFEKILEKYGYTASRVALENILHLKTGVASLDAENLLVAGEFVDNPVFDGFNSIIVDPAEAYAANCIRVNEAVIVPAGHEKTKRAIEKAGYPTIETDVSEFRKLDGGLSCLSLRFSVE